MFPGSRSSYPARKPRCLNLFGDAAVGPQTHVQRPVRMANGRLIAFDGTWLTRAVEFYVVVLINLGATRGIRPGVIRPEWDSQVAEDRHSKDRLDFEHT